jgi:general secretion pathway protein G
MLAPVHAEPTRSRRSSFAISSLASRVRREGRTKNFTGGLPMTAYRKNNKGFTLVEILIVVIILGILAAIVIPQFTNASTDARKNSLSSQLQTMRSQFELYKLQQNDKLPVVFQTTGTKTDVNGATTGTDFGPYLQQTPSNPLNQGVDIVVGNADLVYGAGSGTTTAGWLMNNVTGKIWATSTKFTKVYNETDPRGYLPQHR